MSPRRHGANCVLCYLQTGVYIQKELHKGLQPNRRHEDFFPQCNPFVSFCPHFVKREANSVHFAALLKAVSQFPRQIPLE